MKSDGAVEHVLGAWSLRDPAFCHFSLPWDYLSVVYSPATAQRRLPPFTPGKNLSVGTGGVGFGVCSPHPVMGGAREYLHLPPEHPRLLGSTVVSSKQTTITYLEKDHRKKKGKKLSSCF